MKTLRRLDFFSPTGLGSTLLLAALFTGAVGCSNSGTAPASQSAPPSGPLPQGAPTAVVLPADQKAVVQHHLYHYPEITVLLAVKDVRSTTAQVLSAGGRVVYDPNHGGGSAIGFLVVDLPPEKVLDDTFIKSLDLKAIAIDQDPNAKIQPLGQTPSSMKALTVPFHEVNVPQLRRRKPGRGLGEGITVAVIDTGVDASHPAFQDRVVYWQDMTREGDFVFQSVSSGQTQVKLPSGKMLDLPTMAKSAAKIAVGVINERAMAAQILEASKVASPDPGLDINQNQVTNDVFAVVATYDPGLKLWTAVVDVDGDGTLSAAELSAPVMDFNLARQFQREAKALPAKAMLRFPSRNQIIQYPIVLHTNAAGDLIRGTLAADFDLHGTHVAGIIGANGPQLEGAAPQAHIMSLKVCSAITCTSSAIVRGLVDAFYNSNGLIPDVVNISLGSAQGFTADVYSYLIRDLASKFGAVFCISASNSGAGFRSINSLGHFGPIISVGASVSRETLRQHYDVSLPSEAPEHGVFGFSSAGPNYTGQLRPNIVAPGSALSSTPMIRSTSDMFNGTSMSAPLTAGTTAAILSYLMAEAETDPDLKKAFDLKAQKIRHVLGEQTRSAPSEMSLVDLPLAVRNSFEATAERLPHQSILRQGYGLIRADRAADTLKSLLVQLGKAPLGLTDFRMNDNKGESPSDRLFDRSVDIEPVKAVVLAVEEDAERPDAVSMDLFRNVPMTLRLKHVEIERPNGAVGILTENLPFDIAVPGLEGQSAREREILLGSAQRNGFLSVRSLHKMETGVSYIAVYELFREGQKVLTLADMVQKPFEFSDGRARHVVPGITPQHLRIPAAHSFHNVDIGANRNHRYPFAVRGNDQSLQVQAYFPARVAGNILVQVYDAAGLKVAEQNTRRALDTNGNSAPVNLTVKTRGKPGIYEVVVSTSSGRFMGPTQYDLLVSAHRFQPDAERLTLKTQNSRGSLPSDFVVSVLNTAGQVSKVTPRVVSFHRAESLTPFPVVPNRWTYKKLEIPPHNPAGQEPSTTDIHVKLGPNSVAKCMSRIDHRLWKIGASGEFEAAHATKNVTSGGKIFSGIPRPVVGQISTDLYVAVETFGCTPPTPQELSGFKPSLDIEAEFPTLLVSEPLNLKVLPAPVVRPVEPSVNLAGNRFLVQIGAPQSLVLPEGVADSQLKLRARARVNLATDHPEISSSIEVDVFQ